ncbi:hypothetical protein LEP1GSC166_3288 [Leptospira kirschneri]|nr:hypothetical protein LEP1GSC166_3288 [Leptospira kirschneri]
MRTKEETGESEYCITGEGLVSILFLCEQRKKQFKKSSKFLLVKFQSASFANKGRNPLNEALYTYEALVSIRFLCEQRKKRLFK